MYLLYVENAQIFSETGKFSTMRIIEPNYFKQETNLLSDDKLTFYCEVLD